MQDDLIAPNLDSAESTDSGTYVNLLIEAGFLFPLKKSWFCVLKKLKNAKFSIRAGE